MQSDSSDEPDGVENNSVDSVDLTSNKEELEEEEVDEECLLPNDLELLSLFFLSISLWKSGIPAMTKKYICFLNKPYTQFKSDYDDRIHSFRYLYEE